MKEANKNILDVDKIIVSNVRHDVFRELYSKLLGVSENMFYLENTQEGGHVNDIDIIKNLKDYLTKSSSENSRRIIVLYTLDIEESMDINYHLIILNI